MEVTLLNKGDAQAIRWVKKASTKDHVRFVLSLLDLRGGVLSACDGFRIHRWIFPQGSCVAGLPDGLYQMDVSGKYLIYEQNVEGFVYPDLDKVSLKVELTKDQKACLDDKAYLRIAMNPKFIAEALSIKQKMCLLRVGGHEEVIFNPDEDDMGTFYAIFMPMYSQYSNIDDPFEKLPWLTKQAAIEEAVAQES